MDTNDMVFYAGIQCAVLFGQQPSYSVLRVLGHIPHKASPVYF